MKLTNTLVALLAAFVVGTGAQAATPAKPLVTSSDPETVHAYIQRVTSKKTADVYTVPIVVAARRHQLPPLLVAKVVHRESDFDPNCNTGDCIGLMQVNPSLWARKGEHLYRVADNLEAGCRLLAYLHGRFPNWPQALTAYNYGEFHPVTRGVGTSSYAYLVLSGR